MIKERKKAMELDDKARLAVLTAMKKAVDAQIKLVRPEVDREAYDAYQQDDVDRMALKVAGQKVGTISVETSMGIEVTDPDAFLAWAEGAGLAEEVTILTDEGLLAAMAWAETEHPEYVETITESDPNWEKKAKVVGRMVIHKDTGEQIPGVEAVLGRAKTVVRGCKPEDVIPAVRELTEGAVEALLLGEGE